MPESGIHLVDLETFVVTVGKNPDIPTQRERMESVHRTVNSWNAVGVGTMNAP